MRIDRTELRKGVAETRRFLVSHHEPSEWYRCYSPVLFGRQIRICARCLGIYPGIVAGIVAYLVAPASFTQFLLVAVLPIPALVDWGLTSFTDRRGYNGIRTITGASLGYGYGLGLGLLFGDADVRVVGLGIIFAVSSVILLVLEGGEVINSDGFK